MTTMDNPYLVHKGPTGRIQMLKRNGEFYTYFGDLDQIFVRQDYSNELDLSLIAGLKDHAVVESFEGGFCFRLGKTIYAIDDFALRPFLELPEEFDDRRSFTFACVRNRMFVVEHGHLFILNGESPILLVNRQEPLEIASDGHFLFIFSFENVLEYFTRVCIPLTEPEYPIHMMGHNIILSLASGSSKDFSTFDCSTMRFLSGNEEESDSSTDEEDSKNNYLVFETLSEAINHQIGLADLLEKLENIEGVLTFDEFKLIGHIFETDLNEMRLEGNVSGFAASALCFFLTKKSFSDEWLSECAKSCIAVYMDVVFEQLETGNPHIFAIFLIQYAIYQDELDSNDVIDRFFLLHQEALLREILAIGQGHFCEEIAVFLIQLKLHFGFSEGINHIVRNTEWTKHKPFDILMQLQFEELAMEYLDYTDFKQPNPILEVELASSINRLIPIFWDKGEKKGSREILHRIIELDHFDKITPENRRLIIEKLAGYRDNNNRLASHYLFVKYYPNIQPFYDLIIAESNYLTKEDISFAAGRLHVPQLKQMVFFSEICKFVAQHCDMAYKTRFFNIDTELSFLQEYDYFGFSDTSDIFERNFSKLPDTKFKVSRIKRADTLFTPALTRLFNAYTDSSYVERSSPISDISSEFYDTDEYDDYSESNFTDTSDSDFDEE